MHLIRRIVAGTIAASAMLACGERAPEIATDSVAAIAAATTPVARTLPAGTSIEATLQDSISSRHNRVGDRINALVSRNVLDAAGHVLIAGGSPVRLMIATLHRDTGAPAPTAALTLDVAGLIAADTPYTPSATAGRVAFTLVPGATKRDRDLVVTAGTPVTIRLTHPLDVTAKPAQPALDRAHATGQEK